VPIEFTGGVMLEPKPEIFRAIVDRVESGVYAIDLEQKISYWNQGAEKITGYLSQEVLGRTCADKFLVECGEHNPLTCTQHCSQESTRDGVPKMVATYLRHRSGHVLPVRLWTMGLKDAAGAIVGAMKIFSEQVAFAVATREEVPAEISENLDQESGAISRVGVDGFLRKQVEAFEKLGRPCGLIAIHMEGFEGFRQAHGKEGAGAFAREMSSTLKELVRRTDVLGRWDEQHFVAVLPGCGVEPLEKVAGRMSAIASQVAIPWWGKRLSLSASVRIMMISAGDTVEAIEARLDAPEGHPGSAKLVKSAGA